MLIVSGRVRDVIEREAGNPGNTWVERTLVVEDWGQTIYVTASRDFNNAGLPEPGTDVAVDVSVRSYVGREGKPGHSFTGHRINVEATAALHPASARVAS